MLIDVSGATTGPATTGRIAGPATTGPTTTGRIAGPAAATLSGVGR